MWLLLLWCCGRQPSPVTAVPDTGTGTGTGSAPPEDDALSVHEPEWTADEVVAAIETLLSRPPPDPVSLNNDAFIWIMGNGDNQCPGDLSFRIGDCTASSGWRYFGIADYFDDIKSSEEGGDWSASLALGDLLFTDPDGGVSLIGGTYALQREGGAFSGEVTGTFRLPDLGGWYETGSFAWWIDAQLDGDVWLEVNGALGAGEGSGLHFDALVFGGACADAPTGALQLRDASGRWYRLAFSAQCDGCGTLTYAEQVDMGAACVDTGPFFADLMARLQAPPARLAF